jgi:hypothetical protein
LGDALSERDRDRIRMKALSISPLAFGLGIPLPPALRGVTLESDCDTVCARKPEWGPTRKKREKWRFLT